MGQAARGLTLDTGALLRAERGGARARALHRRLADADGLATVPTAVLAEAWRGGRQEELLRLLDVCEIEPLDRELAERAGELLARAGHDDPVDAIVAASAARRGDIVLTSDADDLQRLADDLGTIRVLAV
jgi:predicted nucleic acid-binding protein